MGKNLFYRILMGFTFGPVIFFSAIYFEKLFFIIIFLILIFSLREFYYLMFCMNIIPHSIYGYFFGIIIFTDMVFNEGKDLLLILLFFLLAILPKLVKKESENIFNEISGTVFGTLYLSVFLPAVLLIYPHIDSSSLSKNAGGKLVSLILISTWMLDTFAYFTGKFFGRHRFFHSISPKKTLEGALGGLIGAIITSVAAKYIYVGFLSFCGAVGIGLIVGFFGQMGDLIESSIKRKAGVKDSSAIIPGHGGILDRFDSLILISPVSYIFIKYLFFN